MIFDILLYTSLGICITGICCNIYFWTTRSCEILSSHGKNRFTKTIQGVVGVIFSKKLLNLIQAFFLDIILQRRSLKSSPLRWIMHLLIFFGFTALVLMHAMDTLVTERFFPYYYSTINPFFFLRSLFGLMVLCGIGIAVWRRYLKKPDRIRNTGSDLFLILLVFCIIFSGILLEGMKMASVKEFTVMVEDYAGLSYDDEDVMALEAYWVKDFALVSPRISTPFDPDTISLGMEMHESSCMDCHSPNKSAFLGYAAAKLLSPVALTFDRLSMSDIFYYIHILACFIGLALIPFGKMFHIFATPVSLFNNSVRHREQTFPDGRLTRQLMELNACTHCCTCNQHCSAGMIRETVPNEFILPSEKIRALKNAVIKKQLDRPTLFALFQGVTLCTSCDRCTVLCPSGIHLKSLWIDVKENLAQQHPENPLFLTGFSFNKKISHYRKKQRPDHEKSIEPLEACVSPIDRSDCLAVDSAARHSDDLSIPVPTQTFANCFGCQNCSTICPVVAQFDTPENDLTLMPHQIMYTLGLGLTNIAHESSMIWNCLSCYQCQENCPQNVSVCDILFLLKNQTFKQLQDKSP